MKVCFIHHQTIMDRRIKPWVNKKIVEYIGEPEPALVEFICSKVLAGSAPQSIINDVQMVRLALCLKHVKRYLNITLVLLPIGFR